MLPNPIWVKAEEVLYQQDDNLAEYTLFSRKNISCTILFASSSTLSLSSQQGCWSPCIIFVALLLTCSNSSVLSDLFGVYIQTENQQPWWRRWWWCSSHEWCNGLLLSFLVGCYPFQLHFHSPQQQRVKERPNHNQAQPVFSSIHPRSMVLGKQMLCQYFFSFIYCSITTHWEVN